jgi:DNA-binding beta-propeller fold protein YncE
MKKSVILSLCLAFIVAAVYVMVAGCGSAATSGGSSSSSSPWIYCGNSVNYTVSIINGSTNTVTGSIEFANDINWLAASPDGTHIYCLSSGTNEVYSVDTATNTIDKTMFVAGSCTAYDQAAVSADNKFLYITKWNTNTLYKVNLSTLTTETAAVSSNPYCMVLSDDRKTAYIPVYSSFVRVVSLETLAMHTINALTNQSQPYYICAAVKNNKLYMSLQSSKECLEIDLGTETITKVMTTDAPYIQGLLALPGANKLYASNAASPGQIRVIDTTVPTYESTIITGAASFVGPGYMAATSDGSKVYVYDWSKSAFQIAVVNTTNNSIEAYIPVGAGNFRQNNPVIIYK